MRGPVIAALALSWGLAGCGGRGDGVLSGALTADNAFYAYLGTSPSDRGALIAQGEDWRTAVAIKPTRLAAGRTYYLHVVAINYGDEGALLGAFELGGGFHFAGGGRQLLTGTANWSGGFNNPNSSVTPQPWVAPAGAVASQGANGVGPWGVIAGVDPAALWIWPTDPRSAPSGPPQACAACTVDFSATIVPDQLAGGG